MPPRQRRQRQGSGGSESDGVRDPWRWEFTRPAARQLANLNKEVQERIIANLDLLVANPMAVDTKKLTDIEGYRLRVGDYRVLYEVNKNDRVFVVFWVGDGRDSYR